MKSIRNGNPQIGAAKELIAPSAILSSNALGSIRIVSKNEPDRDTVELSAKKPKKPNLLQQAKVFASLYNKYRHANFDDFEKSDLDDEDCRDYSNLPYDEIDGLRDQLELKKQALAARSFDFADYYTQSRALDKDYQRKLKWILISFAFEKYMDQFED